MIEPQYLIIGGAAAALGAGTLIARTLERRRRAAFEEYCLIRGFRFEPERADGERAYRDILAAFHEGRRHRWGPSILGTKHGAPFTAFEYRWVTGGGRNSAHHVIAAILWEDERVTFPRFAIAPEGWFARVAERFGAQDIDFADSPDFSRAYRLQGPDEAGVRTLFTPAIRRFFEATPRQHVAGGGHALLWWRSGRLPKPHAFDEWIEQGDHVRRRFFPA